MSVAEALRERDRELRRAQYDRAPMYIIGLDLGQPHEPTGLCVLEQNRPPEIDLLQYERDEDVPPDEPSTFIVRHIERFPLKTKYPAIVAGLQTFISASAPIQFKHELVVNITATGTPVTELMTKAGLNPHCAMLTNAATETHENSIYQVPVRSVLSRLQIAFMADRLKFETSHPAIPDLAKELSQYSTAKLTPDSDVPWRVGKSDDLIMALGLALWYGERPRGIRIMPSVREWFSAF